MKFVCNSCTIKICIIVREVDEELSATSEAILNFDKKVYDRR